MYKSRKIDALSHVFKKKCSNLKADPWQKECNISQSYSLRAINELIEVQVHRYVLNNSISIPSGLSGDEPIINQTKRMDDERSNK